MPLRNIFRQQRDRQIKFRQIHWLFTWVIFFFLTSFFLLIFFFFFNDRISLSMCLSPVMTVKKGKLCTLASIRNSTVKNAWKYIVSKSACTLGYAAIVFFASPRPLKQIQHSHWSKIGAKPHLGTLPSLKQIRPQRLIKNSQVLSSPPQTRGYQRGEPFSATPLRLKWTHTRQSAAFLGQKVPVSPLSLSSKTHFLCS